ncbi:MAG: hypothetical protein EOO28_32580 [Comamonadaceae bacterium]|nr:MAG: hypothetical protein EOO28_32580 [Comamonadaceae bacterium]
MNMTQHLSSPTAPASSAQFIHAIQKTGYEARQTDPRGPVDLDGFIRALDAFPWIDQHIAWDELQDGPLPSIVLQNTADRSELWVTALASPSGSGPISDPDQWILTEYQLHYMSIKPRKSLFGFGKETLSETFESAEVETREQMIALCRLFYEGRQDELDRALKKAAEQARWRN